MTRLDQFLRHVSLIARFASYFGFVRV